MLKNKTWIYMVIGFLIGAMFTDYCNLKERYPYYERAYEFGRLLLAQAERMDVCPVCGYEFHYVYDISEEHMQQLIDDYLGGE